MKKYIIAIPALALVAGTGLTMAVGSISAHGFGQGDGTLIERLASTFGVSEDEVQAVFDDIRDEHQADREAEFATRLEEAVANGDLTEDQKNLILEKRAEMEANRETNIEAHQEMTKEERREAFEAEREATDAWLDANGIDRQYLMGPEIGRRGMHGDMERPVFNQADES